MADHRRRTATPGLRPGLRPGGGSWMDVVEARLRERAGNPPAGPPKAALPPEAPTAAALPLPEGEVEALVGRFRKG